MTILNPPVVLNLYAGPGAGKSTHAALTFGCLKSLGYRVELVTEFAKELTFEGRANTLACQTYIFGKQLWRQERLRGRVDVIVTDSPLLLSSIYGDTSHSGFDRFIEYQYDRFDNLNVFVQRDAEHHPYQQYGRNQSEAEARNLDERILELLSDQSREVEFHGVAEPAYRLVHMVEKQMVARGLVARAQWQPAG